METPKTLFATSLTSSKTNVLAFFFDILISQCDDAPFKVSLREKQSKAHITLGVFNYPSAEIPEHVKAKTCISQTLTVKYQSRLWISYNGKFKPMRTNDHEVILSQLNDPKTTAVVLLADYEAVQTLKPLHRKLAETASFENAEPERDYVPHTTFMTKDIWNKMPFEHVYSFVNAIILLQEQLNFMTEGIYAQFDQIKAFNSSLAFSELLPPSSSCQPVLPPSPQNQPASSPKRACRLAYE